MPATGDETGRHERADRARRTLRAAELGTVEALRARRLADSIFLTHMRQLVNRQ